MSSMSNHNPNYLHILHGALKGANGWLKVAGLRTRLNAYDPASRKGLQVPGDAQEISLDFTLVDPVTAEDHLRTDPSAFPPSRRNQFRGAGHSQSTFQAARLGKRGCASRFSANVRGFARAGPPCKPRKMTLTGRQPVDRRIRPTRRWTIWNATRSNEQYMLKGVMTFLEEFCLDTHKVNGFLIRSEQSRERQAVEVLSDLRLVHLIHQTITPHKAGERYQAYLLDYSLFTGFRRRPSIAELLPSDGRQFKAKELRSIPELPKAFLSSENSGE